MTRDALAKAVPGTENWRRLNAQRQEQRTRLKQLTSQAEATDKSMCGLVTTVRDYYIALQGLFAAMSKGYQYVEQARTNSSDSLALLSRSTSHWEETSETMSRSRTEKL